MLAMFSFYVYTYGVASEIVFKKYDNITTGKRYEIDEIVATIYSVMIAMMVIPSIMPIMPATFNALVCAQKLYDVIERTPAIVSGNVENTPPLADAIYFDKIKFRYPKQLENAKDIFCNASFKIKAGTSTAIVGPSGTGKSTIAQMISRFYDPLEGKVSFDATDLKMLSLKCLRAKIGYVSQEPVLIIGTVRENLSYGKVDATEAEMWAALEMSNALFLKEMEHGLDTYVGTGSVVNLSGGQEQKIAIARALIRKPEILILDEATSALDSRSEQDVQTAIDKIAFE